MKHVIYEKILVAVDFSEHSEVALEKAILMAKQNDEFELVLLWVDTKSPNYDVVIDADVVDAGTRDPDDASDSRLTEAETRLGLYVDRVKKHDIPVIARVESGYPDEVIVEVAMEIGAVMVMVGTRGLTGFKRFLLGSVAEKVVRSATTSVLVTRGEPKTFSRILVATDFSPAAEHALQLAIALAPSGVKIDVVHAWQYPPGTRGASDPNPTEGPLADLRKQLVKRIEKVGTALVRRYRGPDRTLEFTNLFGPAAQVVHDHLQSDDGAAAYDLVAMGTHGHRGFRRFLLGSVAEATVRHAPCSVLVTHEAKPSES